MLSQGLLAGICICSSCTRKTTYTNMSVCFIVVVNALIGRRFKLVIVEPLV